MDRLINKTSTSLSCAVLDDLKNLYKHLINSSCKSIIVFIAISISIFPLASHSANNENHSEGYNDNIEMMGYDSIINQLNRESNRSNASRAKLSESTSPDALDSIWFHGGVGLTTFMQSLNLDNGKTYFIAQRGVSVSGGIDLFSSNWIAEGSIRNFGESDDANLNVALKEFDLKIFFHDQLTRRFGFHFGGGLSARYMTIRRKGFSPAEYTTPTSVLAASLDYFFTNRISIGLEGAARNAMISETVDRDSFDATIRLDIQL